MKPAPFVYHRAESRDEVDAVLAKYGSEAKLLAGGQSLVPMLNFRLATPEHIVDINHLPGEPAEARDADGALSFGPLVRQESAELSSMIAARVPLLAEALGYVAHPAIRSRGTIVGSVIHADPAAELPAVLVLLDGEVIARSVRGRRAIGAGDLYTGLFETAVADDEWVEEVRFPSLDAEQGWAFEEFSQRSGDYGLCGVAALAAGASGGTRVSLAYLGMGAVPLRLDLREISEADVSTDALEEAVHEAVRGAPEPPSDLHASASYRRFLARRLGARAIRRAIEKVRTSG